MKEPRLITKRYHRRMNASTLFSVSLQRRGGWYSPQLRLMSIYGNQTASEAATIIDHEYTHHILSRFVSRRVSFAYDRLANDLIYPFFRKRSR